MATRAAKQAPPECWTVAFYGRGDVSEDNAKELLDKQLFPVNAEIQVLLPLTIPKRGSRGLRNVATLLAEEFDDIPTQNVSPEDMVAQLLESQKDGETVYLVLLGVDDPELAEAALDAGIPVKDLCAALDDVEFEPEAPAEPEPEPEAPRRGRGRPRKDVTVAAEVAGPATVVTQNERADDTDAAQLLRAAIQQIVREELSMHPGVHAFNGEAEEPAEEKTVRAFINDDGEYRRATKRSRARDGETEVMLTETEATDAGLTS